jgi:hypothetical protein
VSEHRQAAEERTPAHVIGAADVNRVAAGLAPGTSALLLLVEQIPAGAAPQRLTEPSLADQLARFGAMIKEGLLTEEEYAAAKAKLLE